jgi:hypothetical protein
MSDPELDDDELITCWCGAVGTYEELFDFSGLDHCCGGSGELHCECGGDLCVCHHHGSIECPGCADCEPAGDFDDDYDDFDDSEDE